MKFLIDTKEAVITNVNTRIEKHGPDAKELGVDIKFKASVYVEVLQQLVLENVVDYRSFLFDGDEVKEQGLNPISWGREFEEHGLSIRWAPGPTHKRVFPNVVLGKISAIPKFGGLVELTFRAQISAISTVEDIGLLNQAMLMDKVTVKTTPPPPSPQTEMEIGGKQNDDEKGRLRSVT